LEDSEVSDSEARKFAYLWGSDPVHPSLAAFQKMADDITANIAIEDARYTDLLKKQQSQQPNLSA
jgi:hypothetical protein